MTNKTPFNLDKKELLWEAELLRNKKESLTNVLIELIPKKIVDEVIKVMDAIEYESDERIVVSYHQLLRELNLTSKEKV